MTKLAPLICSSISLTDTLGEHVSDLNIHVHGDTFTVGYPEVLASGLKTNPVSVLEEAVVKFNKRAHTRAAITSKEFAKLQKLLA